MPPTDAVATSSHRSGVAADSGGEAAHRRRRFSVQSLPTFVSHVAEITDRSPNMREIVLEGGLETFASLGGDQFVYLMVRRPGGADVPADHTMTAQLAADPLTGPIGAYYTVRSWDPRAHRITLWMVRHGHRNSVGGWVDRCTIGERVALWGPRAGFGAQPGAGSWLFVADESGFGAVAALLDELPSGASARVLVETVNAGHKIELPSRDGVTVTWLYRTDDDAGTGGRLPGAVRELDLTADSARGLVAFGAGESAQMTKIRRHLRRHIRIPADNISVTGYWRHATAG
jgi:NADPH-dependent ferric siderophore reductase